MANDDHVSQVKKGVAAWNAWREENPDIRPDFVLAHLKRARLDGANLSGANLAKADLSEADLRGANLSEANLQSANLSKADLCGSKLLRADLRGADLCGADLGVLEWVNPGEARRPLIRWKAPAWVKLFGAFRGADLRQAMRVHLDGESRGADLRQPNLVRAYLDGAHLDGANLRGADLSMADLRGADLSMANLGEANLCGACLFRATLVDTDLTGADLTGCRIYGISTWGLKLGRVKQQNLVITREHEPEITVDNIEVAQSIYLMLNNQKVRDVINTITSKAVLILGRFTDERKAVLDALRDELRKRDYLPILFDFAVPATRNITETVTLLARMARFIIADLTDPSSIPQELQAIIPSVRVPIQPLLLEGSSLYSMFKDFEDFLWVLPVYQYKKPEQLLATLAEKVIAPAEGKARALADRRRIIEAE